MRTCSVEGCDRGHYGRGWCKPHYLKAWSKGEHTTQPRELVAQGATLEERLQHIGWTVTPSGCWEWNGSLNGKGYGQVAVGVYDGKVCRPMLSHRAAYKAWVGDPAGMIVCHSCDNPPCMNPAHLFLGTYTDNSRDMTSKGRNATGEHRTDSRITQAQVEEIRTRYAAGGIAQHALAAEYGVSQQLVSLLVRGLRRTMPLRPGATSRASLGT